MKLLDDPPGDTLRLLAWFVREDVDWLKRGRICKSIGNSRIAAEHTVPSTSQSYFTATAAAVQLLHPPHRER